MAVGSKWLQNSHWSNLRTGKLSKSRPSSNANSHSGRRPGKKSGISLGGRFILWQCRFTLALLLLAASVWPTLLFLKKDLNSVINRWSSAELKWWHSRLSEYLQVLWHLLSTNKGNSTANTLIFCLEEDRGGRILLNPHWLREDDDWIVGLASRPCKIRVCGAENDGT